MAGQPARIEGPAAGLTALLRYSDVGMAALALLVLGMMIVPLPKQVLDILIALNMSAAVLILLMSIYAREPLQFSTLPSVLLLATLFRLGLNVLATRLILLHGDAGQVIHAFGSFVVGGNYVVGVVVFLILVVIQFVVITNGAGRVAEVAARFTLDAMPGKQVSIDADLNAGLIDEAEARRRRKAIEAEAGFYGAMDGASKFVKGDAIAGIIIIVINSIGGFIIGVIQRGLSPQDALQTYTLLTVGDGLVTQIPALLISTATGILVTRTQSEANLGRDVAGQLLNNYRALAMAAGVLGALALVPGLPKVPFLLVAGAAGAAAYAVRKTGEPAEAESPAAGPQEQDTLAGLLSVDPLEVEIGFGLVSLVDGSQPGNLLNRVVLVRRQIAQELGFMMPVVRIHDSMDLRPQEYRVKLRGTAVATGDVRPDRLLALNSALGEESVEGIPTTEPAFGLPALWISRSHRELAEARGYTVVDASSVVATHFTEVVKGFAHVILSRQDVQNLLDNLKREFPAVVDEVVPRQLSLTDVHRVLQELLREQICIRDLLTVMETLAGYCKLTTEPEVLTELVRQALGRAICAKYLDEQGALHALALDPVLQERLQEALQPREQQVALEIDPDLGRELIERTAAGMERMANRGFTPVLLVAPSLRKPLRRYLEPVLPKLGLISYAEVPAGLRTQNEGVVSL